MKFLTLLTIFIAISPIFNYTLAVFGDIGEIVPFRKVEFDKATKTPLPETLLKLAISTITEGKTESDAVCKFGEKGKEIDVTKKGALANWESVLESFKDRIKVANHVVILGDMVYTESKFFTTAQNPVWNSPFPLPADPVTKIPTADAIKKSSVYWEARRRCGWIAFYHSIKNSSSAAKLMTGVKISAAVSLIPGNHLYDVSPTWELDNMSKIVTEATGVQWFNGGGLSSIKTDNWHNAARVTTAEDKEGKVIFIDFNSAAFELTDNCKCDPKKAVESKSQCIAEIKKNVLKSFLMAREQIKEENVYSSVEAVFQAIKAAKLKNAKNDHYIVLRAHHPPFNVEGDVMGILNYQSLVYGGMTLVQAAGDAKISLMLASHHHSSQVWAFPYIKAGKLQTKTSLGPANKDKRIASASKCFHYADAKCTKSQTFKETIKTNFAAPEYFVVVLVGSSGRFFDPVEQDFASYGALLWALADSSNKFVGTGDIEGEWKTKSFSPKYYYGGAMINFNAKGIVVNFHDINKKDSPTMVLTLEKSAKVDKSSAILKYVEDHVGKKFTRRLNKKLKN